MESKLKLKKNYKSRLKPKGIEDQLTITPENISTSSIPHSMELRATSSSIIESTGNFITQI
jgi:hypothetical protein